MIYYELLGNLVNWTKKDTDMNLDSTILVVKESIFLNLFIKHEALDQKGRILKISNLFSL
jgi:hypothetical protein